MRILGVFPVVSLAVIGSGQGDAYKPGAQQEIAQASSWRTDTVHDQNERQAFRLRACNDVDCEFAG